MPLTNVDFNNVVPTPSTVATPNTVLATPFRSHRSDASPALFNTPGSVASRQEVSSTPGQTPIRDKLNINPEEALEASETPVIQKQVSSIIIALFFFFFFSREYI